MLLMAVKTKAALSAAAEYSEISKRLNELTSARDEALRQIALQYDAEIERAKTEQAEAADTVLEYVQANQAHIFPVGKKTAKWEGLTISYRDNNPKVELIDQEAGWEVVLQRARKFAPDYILVKEELSKSKLIADSAKLQKVLPKLGIQITSTVNWAIKAQ